jgi:hypothetical protein
VRSGGPRRAERPPGVATREAEGTVEWWRVLGYVHHRAEQPGAPGRLLRLRRRAGEGEDHRGAGRVAGERLAGRAGQVPAVQHQLVESHGAHHLRRQPHTPGLGHPVPGRRLAPGRHQLVEALREQGAPPRIEVLGGRRPRPRPGAAVRGLGGLAGRPGERERQAEQMVQQGSDRVLGARRRSGEVVVGDAVQEAGDLSGGGLQIDGGHDGSSQRRQWERSSTWLTVERPETHRSGLLA